jgi:hypothetical protein
MDQPEFPLRILVQALHKVNGCESLKGSLEAQLVEVVPAEQVLD